MTQSRPPSGLPEAWERYRHNPIRHLTAIARHAELATMTRLGQRGYSSLSMSYSGPIMLLGVRSQRLTELAEALGISKQLCLQTLRQLERIELIQRTEDPDDRRAKRVELSAKGRQLTVDAFQELADIQSGYADLIGNKAMAHLEDALVRCALHLQTPGIDALQNLRDSRALAASLVGAVTRQLHQRLMASNADYGHHNLQMSFAQVLTNIDLHGTSVSAIAAQNGVTPQAISRIAKELEDLGYIERRSSTSDGRARILFFTPAGVDLICDSVNAMATVENELASALGTTSWRDFTAALRTLYERIGAESGLVAGYDPVAAQRLYADGDDQHGTYRPSLTELLLYFVKINGAGDEAVVADEHGNFRLNPAFIEKLGSTRISRRDVEKVLQEHVDTSLLQRLHKQLTRPD